MQSCALFAYTFHSWNIYAMSLHTKLAIIALIIAAEPYCFFSDLQKKSIANATLLEKPDKKNPMVS